MLLILKIASFIQVAAGAGPGAQDPVSTTAPSARRLRRPSGERLTLETPARVRVGTAGWAIPRAAAEAFATEGATLSRYAQVFNAVEINSTFRKVHRPDTLRRWVGLVPSDFEFSLKLPKTITHDGGLAGFEAPLDGFLGQVAELGEKAGPLLIQFPPKFAFDADGLDAVCRRIRARGAWPVACEPRHASWFAPAVDEWLGRRRIARVAADPALHAGGGAPGGWRGLSYYRLHGSPRTYYSAYGSDYLRALVARLTKDGAGTIWCIFDNTASGAAAANAMSLAAMLGGRCPRR
ncbi:MAG TPA: DUF72 domain-containing protein [Caulobacteraceae bacterium]